MKETRFSYRSILTSINRLDNKGVTLIEALVAFTIMAAAFAALTSSLHSQFKGLSAIDQSRVIACQGSIQSAFTGIGAGLSTPMNPQEIQNKLAECNQLQDPAAQKACLQPLFGSLKVDDPNIVTLNGCKQTLKDVISRAGSAAQNNPAIQAALNTINATLAATDQCLVTSYQEKGVAGMEYNYPVNVHVPFENPTNQGGTITMSGAVTGSSNFGDSQAPNPPDITTGTEWRGRIDIPGSQSANLLFTLGQDLPASFIQFTAASVTDQTPKDNACPLGQTVSPDGTQCLVQCTSANTARVTWSAPPIPKIEPPFQVSPSTILQGDKVTIVANVIDARSVEIDQVSSSSGSFPIYPATEQQPGRPLAYFQLDTPTENTTYIVTALGVRDQDKLTVSRSVTVIPKSVAVTIDSPSQHEQVNDTAVDISGHVSPPPSATGQMKARIISGNLLREVDVDTSGAFEAPRFSLNHTFTFDDVTWLADFPSVDLGTCGAIQDNIYAQVNIPDTSVNGFRVDIVAAAIPPAPGPTLGSVFFDVEFVINVFEFDVTWAQGCPGDPVGTLASYPNINIRANQPPVQVGSVNCGYTTNTAPIPPCNDVSNVDIYQFIGTSERTLHTPISWFVHVPACM